MNAEQPDQPRSTQGTVMTMPPASPQDDCSVREPQAPGATTGQSTPSGKEHEPGDEPGYGHGV